MIGGIIALFNLAKTGGHQISGTVSKIQRRAETAQGEVRALKEEILSLTHIDGEKYWKNLEESDLYNVFYRAKPSLIQLKDAVAEEVERWNWVNKSRYGRIKEYEDYVESLVLSLSEVGKTHLMRSFRERWQIIEKDIDAFLNYKFDVDKAVPVFGQ